MNGCVQKDQEEELGGWKEEEEEEEDDNNTTIKHEAMQQMYSRFNSILLYSLHDDDACIHSFIAFIVQIIRWRFVEWLHHQHRF